MTDRSSWKGFLDIPNDDVLTNCMHCGLCLPVCPTYELSGLERSSPRGRIRLIKHVAEGKMQMTPEFVDEMNFCLDCQACETACPAGVRYGSLVVAARSMVFEEGQNGLVSKFLSRFFLGIVFGSRRLLHFFGRAIRLYQRTGVSWFMDRTGLLRMFSAHLANVHQLMPRMSEIFSSDVLPERLPSYGSRRCTVGFVPGCIMDVAFSGINIETIELLRKVGCDVVIPASQGCCGSLAGHSGDSAAAKKHAQHMIRAFAGTDIDYIIMNSAGCGAFMKEYGEVFADDPQLSQDASRISAKILDITEFLISMQWMPSTPRGKTEERIRVTYHDACHLAHAQSITAEPRELIRSIPGIEYVELPEASWCCGSAGIYNVVRFDDSMLFLNRKIDNIAEADPDIILTGNPGCMLQIEHGLRARGSRARVLHTATFLNRLT